MSDEVMHAEITGTLEHVAHDFDLWRTTRQHKGRIPERLWQAALSLTKSYPPSQVSQKLHLNYSELIRRLDHDRGAHSSMKNLSFIEVGLHHDALCSDLNHTHSRCLFDVETPSGTRYRCTVESDIPERLLSFFHSLR